MIERIFKLFYFLLDYFYKLFFNHYRTHHARPVYAKNNHSIIDKIINKKSLGIIMQGPLMIEDSFTYETLKLYKIYFDPSSTIIILSTWIDSPLMQVEKIRGLGVEVLLNEKPQYAGVSNINYQIVSTRNGIKKAKELNVEYVIKTRTDQRMYSPNVANYLYSLINVFPIKRQDSQKERIIGLSLNTFKYRLYGFSDMFQYGNIYDMSKFWDIGLDKRSLSKEYIEKNGTSLKNYSQLKLCEVYLTSEYLQSIGCQLNWTLKDSWEKYSNHFCIIDTVSVDLYWPKYVSEEYRWLNYNVDHKTNELTFNNWLSMYNNIENIKIDEQLIEN